MRAVVYTRQSLDKAGHGAAVARQREDCEKLCADRGWKVVREYSDNDVSASSSKPRPQFRAMLAAVESGEVEVVVAWHIDRLTRKLTELEELIEIASRTGVRIATVTGDVDLSTDAGRLVGRILASVARGEVERKGARQRRAQQQAAEEGRPAGGRRPYGYEPDGMTIRESEAVHVREAYRHVLEGGSLRGLTRQWNDEGLRTSRDAKWVPSTLRDILKNPRYAARRSYRGEVVGPATWPAVIDDDTYDAVHAILMTPSRRTTTVPLVRLYLLPGLARCYCGALIKTGRTQHGKRTYMCREPDGRLSVAAEPIDELVVGLVLERLSRPDARSLVRDDRAADVGALRRRGDEIHGRLDDLASALGAGVLTLPAVTKASKALKSELAEVEAQIADVSAGDAIARLVTADDVTAAWDGADLEQKRGVIDTLMTISLHRPLRGRQPFDPENVKIRWRHG